MKDDAGAAGLKVTLRRLIEQSTGIPRGIIEDDSSLRASFGVDSFSMAALQVNIEAAFNISFSYDELSEADTINRISAVVDERVRARHADGKPWNETIVDALERRGAAGTEVAIWFESLNKAPLAIRNAELLERGLLAAGRFAEMGVGQGERILIVLPTCEDFPIVFFGTLLAGAVAVPVCPPLSSAQAATFSAAVLRILRLTRSRTLVTSDALVDVVCGDGAVAGQARVLSARDLKNGPVAPVGEPPRPEDLAVIQFSSGSTGDPKGICLSHGNIVSNVRAFQRRIDMTPGGNLMVSWLPLYHDMGLIGALIGTLVTGIPLVLAPPESFMRDPGFWLELLSKYRATITVAPQSAYNLCLLRVRPEQLGRCDLSKLRVLLNGAEPIHADIMRRFAATFAAYGLRNEAITPCYGLAEHTLAVTICRFEDELRSRPVPRGKAEGTGGPPQDAVSVGTPIPGVEVAIWEEAGAALPDGAVGEIVARSPSVAQGVLTAGGMASLRDGGGWLRTGDLGFVSDGELHVVGRKKDMIVVGGLNFHPQDLEDIASRVEGVRPGRVIAFGVEDGNMGTERVVLAAETRWRATEDLARSALEIHRRLVERAGLAPRDVVLLRRGRIPLTTSGKLRRSRLRQQYLTGEIGSPLYSTRNVGTTPV